MMQLTQTRTNSPTTPLASTTGPDSTSGKHGRNGTREGASAAIAGATGAQETPKSKSKALDSSGGLWAAAKAERAKKLAANGAS